MKNKTTIPDEMRIANCAICLLSSTMKDCDSCPFNLGLLYKSFDTLAHIEPKTTLDANKRQEFIIQINDTVSTLKG